MPNCYGYIHRCAGCPAKDQKANILERFDHLWENLPVLRYRCTVYDRGPLYFPFAERRQGQRLFELATPGDHVIFGKSFFGFESVEDVLATKRRWADIDITIHFADLMVKASDELTVLLDAYLACLVQIRRTSSKQEGIDQRDMEMLMAKTLKNSRDL